MTVTQGRAAHLSLALCVLALAAAGCGGEPKTEVEDTAVETPRSRPEHRAERTGPSSPEQIAALRRVQAAVADLQRQCAPQPGTPRAEVERIFGAGRPTTGPMCYSDAPADTSAWWLYELELPASDAHCSTARLNVVYDKDWRVGRSYFSNPHEIQNKLFFSSMTRGLAEQLLWESRRMIEHMKRVRAALGQPFGD